MIILITGASHTGKTLLAQKMLEEFEYPYFSIDHLKMGLIRSGRTDLTPEDDDQLTDYLWPIVREMIKTVIENKQNLIVEGCYVPFDWKQDFQEEYLTQIKLICLSLADDYIDSHFDKIKSHASDIEKRLEDSWLSKDLLKKENEKFASGFKNAGDYVVMIDRDYENTIDSLIKRIYN
ncbi:MAG: adenylate kinase [Lachnospiraceae bacterium]|nr:adenylate kinase [Lachnospiraceae bacterium]